MALTLLDHARWESERIRKKYEGQARIACDAGLVTYHRDPFVAERCCKGIEARMIRQFIGLSKVCLTMPHLPVRGNAG